MGGGWKRREEGLKKIDGGGGGEGRGVKKVN